MGDGIGPELSESAISVLNTIQEKYGIEFEISKLIAGDKSLEQTGKALPEDVIETIKNSDVCLLYTSPSPRDRTRPRMPSSA